MSKMIQVRSVPERLHRELVRRAKRRGLTMTAYIQEILEREIDLERRLDVLEQIEHAEPVELGRAGAADVVRRSREERDSHWDQWSSTRRR